MDRDAKLAKGRLSVAPASVCLKYWGETWFLSLPYLCSPLWAQPAPSKLQGRTRQGSEPYLPAGAQKATTART